MLINAKVLACNFCGKAQYQLSKLVAGKDSNSHICDECIREALEIISEGDTPPAVPEGNGKLSKTA